MNEDDKERHRREKEAYDRTVGGTGTSISSAPVKAPQTFGVSDGSVCIRVGCNKPSVRNVEWEDEYCSNQCVVLHCDQVFKEWVKEQQKALT